ncbi:cysteine peptidase family C39 domain-containing protein [Falsiroseomonas oryzae]|uniref:papain-like cysteine protease family protein n=1 Tax=Falsiroseomonas oryzae TaxID=2766473 RepID=UPI0022EA7396|nr:papain-like cysteine protease family protein [Roseomonas sp. MO-31]
MVTPTDYGHKVSGTGVARYEKVATGDGGDGKWHWIDRQNLDNACGPTCVRMVVKLARGENIGQAYFGGLVALSEQSLSAADTSPLSATAQGAHDFDAAGTLSAHLVKALQDSKIASARKLAATTTDWTTHWGKCSEKNPGILSFKWPSGSAHFVVIAGPISGNANRYLILDPWYGVQHLESAAPITYKPRRAGAVTGQVLATGALQKMAAIVTY